MEFHSGHDGEGLQTTPDPLLGFFSASFLLIRVNVSLKYLNFTWHALMSASFSILAALDLETASQQRSFIDLGMWEWVKKGGVHSRLDSAYQNGAYLLSYSAISMLERSAHGHINFGPSHEHCHFNSD